MDRIHASKKGVKRPIVRENKRERILLVAANLISQYGYKEVSLQRIADRVGLHKTSLFHYFRNKEELLLNILEQSLGEVSINLNKIIHDRELNPQTKLKRAIDNHLTLLMNYFSNANIYLNEFRGLSKQNKKIYLKQRKEYTNNFEKIIVDMKAKGYFSGLDSMIVTFGILGMLNWVTKWFKKDGPITMNEISHIFYKLIYHESGREKDHPF